MNLSWHDTDADVAKSLESTVIEDLRRTMDIDHPSSLIFHSIFLTKDMYGPSVFVWGEKNSNAFHCEYCEKTEWKTLAKMDDEKNSSTPISDDAKL